MDEYLYRYIGFDVFVDMVQSQSLVFVLPIVWEDPKEFDAIEKYISTRNDGLYAMLMRGMMDKTYAQCWTKLAESDAMWRIYSYSGKSLRIKVKKASFYELDNNVEVKDVIYLDDIESTIKEIDENRDIFQLWALKRKAFEHEQEVRIILPYKYPDDETVMEHIKAYIAFGSEEKGVEFIESFKKGSLEENMKYAICLTNANRKDSLYKISFSGIGSFIEGVMVNPFAPQWYVNTVKCFCENNNISFEGQSILYRR